MKIYFFKIICHLPCVTYYMLHVACCVSKVTNINSHSHKPSLCQLPNYAKYATKGSRARFTIGGQCVLLQNSLKIKLFDIFFLQKSQNYCINRIFPDIILNPSKKMLKIIETRPLSSKNAPKCIKKNVKIHDVDKSPLVFGF